MIVSDIGSGYDARSGEIQAGLTRAQDRAGTRAAIAIAMAVAAVSLFFRPPWWAGLTPAIAAAAAAWTWARERKLQNRFWRLKLYYDRARKRVQGEWSGTGVAGDEFDTPDHPYAHDLNLFGEGSLFELLCVGRSGIGQHGLAEVLRQPVDPAGIRTRQEAVRELSGRTELRESIAVLGPHSFSESRWETFTEWLDSPAVTFPAYLGRVLLATAAVLAVLGLMAAVMLLPPLLALRLAAPFLVVHAITGLLFKDRVAKTIASVSALPGETQILREGIELLEQGTWECGRLKLLAERARGGAAAVRSLERLLDGLEQRNKDWFLHLSRLLAVGTQLAIAIERWRLSHSADLRKWMEAWAEFEALNALAGYAFENPENVYPDLVEGAGALFEARELGHPLLPRTGCVRNNVTLNRGQRFYIVSGSNMSGKSTLLRAIGLNAVLAAAGAPVRAANLRLSPVAICASISVADSLLNGKSKFLAEVDRLKLALDTAKSGTEVLFLVDEIFSGTNSSDRRIAAEAVVRTLIERGAIGALSTHDLALTEMAEKLGGVNVHMGSRGRGDPMDFDYVLKAGVTQEANALAIARMAGVPV